MDINRFPLVVFFRKKVFSRESCAEGISLVNKPMELLLLNSLAYYKRVLPNRYAFLRLH